MPKATTNEDIDALIAERGLKGKRVGDVRSEPIGASGKRQSKVAILWDDCPHGEQDVLVTHLMRGNSTRCGTCGRIERNKVRKLREAEAAFARALALPQHRGYTARLLPDLQPIGAQGRAVRRVAFVCPEFHVGEMTLNSFARGSGCPCGKGGIDYTAPGYLYVVRNGRWIKVGICNDHRLKDRLDEHKRQGLDVLLHTVPFAVTRDAKALEDLWKEKRATIPAEFLPTKADLKKGFTEAAPAVPMVIRWIEQQLLPLAVAA